MEKLRKQIGRFPHAPGVYFFKDIKGKILYIGKALDLRNRISQYFGRELESRPNLEPMLSGEAILLEYIVTDSEIEALLLESEMIKRYKPKFNQRWKDDKNFIWIAITKETWPKVFITRNPLDDRTQYFGPFVDASSVRSALSLLRRVFPYRTSNKFPHRTCFWGHLRQCPCMALDSLQYKKDILSLIRFLKGKKLQVIRALENDMKKYSKEQEYEKAAITRDKINALKRVSEMIISSKKEKRSAEVDQALNELKIKLGMERVPARIECYDISNLFGKDATGSMIVFTDGMPDKNQYRRFKIKKIDTINDYAMMTEILTRRFLSSDSEKFGILPELIVIDGGKGQLSAAKKVLDEFNLSMEIIGLAKKNEEIFIYNKGKEAGILEGTFRKIMLPKDSHALFLLQRIRDEAHRFAISHHKLIREKKITKTGIEEIPGIGEKTAKVLLKNFGSVRGIKKASLSKLAEIVGRKKAETIKKSKVI